VNFQILSSVIDELSQLITGARVDRVYEGTGNALCLVLGRDRRHFILLLSPDRSMPRMHLVTKKPAASPSPHVFSLYLRSHVKGARITLVSLLNQDRVAEIRFSRQGSECRLVFELTGSASNIIMTDASLKILAVFYPAPPGDHGKRLLMPGIRYEPPQKKPSPSFSPGSSDAVRCDPAMSRERSCPGSANWEAENLFERLIQERSLESLRAGLRSLVKKTLAKTARRMEALSADLESARQADEYKQAGELILANLRCLEPGAHQAVLSGFDGETVHVRLDPGRSPAGNAQLYFKKYKKAKAGRDIISARLRQTGEEDARLRFFLSELERAEDIDACARIRSDLAANGYLQEKAEEKSKKQSGPAPTPFRKIEYQGWIILVGRNAAGNDYLTTKLARPNDLWLHAEGMPGSHVLVKNPGAGNIPPAVFSKAASLAAFYSKGKAAGKVAVTYTFARHVKKPKGAKPGLVTLAERKTIMAVPEAE
jgi:predicted ribosome quality control (RQC) complex YloA/Tae2 family protein